MLRVPITRPVGNKRFKLSEIELPKRKIRVSNEDFFATIDKSGMVVVELKRRSKTDNALKVEFNVNDYRMAALEVCNEFVGMRRFVSPKADNAIKDWILNTTSSRARWHRQDEYNRVGNSYFLLNIEQLTKRLMEKIGVKIQSSYEIFSERRLDNGRSKATQAFKS